MRAAFLAVLLTACGQSAPADTATPPEDAAAGSTGVGRIAAQPFTLEGEALVGLWSFARDCGLYDLVFQADDVAEYYDYSTEGRVTSYRGTWATADDNRVVLTVRLVDANNAVTGDSIIYNLDVAAPVTDDLTGYFARADGAGSRDVTARRCEEEDRE
jgi:hypothetical protein